jgi:hypothetical protein
LSRARKTVEAHIANIFSKLELPPTADDHPRALAVLAHLQGPVDRKPEGGFEGHVELIQRTRTFSPSVGAI